MMPDDQNSYSTNLTINIKWNVMRSDNVRIIKKIGTQKQQAKKHWKMYFWYVLMILTCSWSWRTSFMIATCLASTFVSPEHCRCFSDYVNSQMFYLYISKIYDSVWNEGLKEVFVMQEADV